MKNYFIILLFALLSTPSYAQWWEAQTSGVTAILNDVYCINEDFVIVVGSGGTILKTVDGGLHWVLKNSGTSSDLKKVQFINTSIGYAVGYSGTLLKTIDAGENWNIIATGFNEALTGLSVIDENTLYVSGDNGLVRRTDNGGVSFSDRSYVTAYPVETIQFLNDNIGYAAAYDQYGYSDDNNFVKTIDGGITWVGLPNQQVSSFHFLNENLGFIRNNFGISKTLDGGLDFVPIAETGFITTDIFALDENVVWNVEDNFMLCGCSYFCIKKVNLSLAPELQQTSNCYTDTNGGSPFKAIHFASETKGYAVGDFGKILKNASGNMENLGIKQFDKKDFMTVYPNPAVNQITVSFKEQPTSSFFIEIHDLLGKKIFVKSYNQNQNPIIIDTNLFTRGIYFVNLQSPEESSIKKFIKE